MYRKGQDPPDNPHLQALGRARTSLDGNVALVMPDGVVRIDVDAYHGGDSTFRRLVKRYSPIPNTVFSTSRHSETGNYRSGTAGRGHCGRKPGSR